MFQRYFNICSTRESKFFAHLMESWKDFVTVPKDEFQLAKRRTVLRIDLDALTTNVAVLKDLLSEKTGKNVYGLKRFMNPVWHLDFDKIRLVVL